MTVTLPQNYNVHYPACVQKQFDVQPDSIFLLNNTLPETTPVNAITNGDTQYVNFESNNKPTVIQLLKSERITVMVEW